MGLSFVMGKISIKSQNLRKMLNLKSHLPRMESVYRVSGDLGKEIHKIERKQACGLFPFLVIRNL